MTDHKLTHATDYRSDIDDLLKWLNNLRKHYSSASAPTIPDPEEGQLWWDSDNDYFLAYNGTEWIEEIIINASKTQKGICSFTEGDGIDITVSSGAVTIATESNICKIATGQYTGDGSEGQTVTVTGVDIKYLAIWTHLGAAQLTTKLDQTWGDYAFWHGTTPTVEHAWMANKINEIGDGYFIVDDAAGDAHPNKNGTTYDYLAIGV